MRIHKKMCKLILWVCVAQFIIYVVNAIYASLYVLNVLTFDKSRHDWSCGGAMCEKGYTEHHGDRWHIFTKESLLPSIIAQYIYIYKKNDQAISIWYGGRLPNYPQWSQSIINWAYEEEPDHAKEFVEEELKTKGFWNIANWD